MNINFFRDELFIIPMQIRVVAFSVTGTLVLTRTVSTGCDLRHCIESGLFGFSPPF